MPLVILLIFVSGCSSLPTDIDRTPSYLLAKTSQTRLGAEIQPLVVQHPGESGFYGLTTGIDAFALRFELVRSAEKTLDVQYYIWHDDMTGKVLHNQLLAAADRGVRVRILLDDLDTAGKDAMLAVIDAHPNVEVRLFNPFANRQSRFLDFLTDTRRINRRMHNKSLTADNQATIFGGRNIGDEYFEATQEGRFSDLDVLAIGPVVTEVSQAFDLYWNSQWVYPLAALVKVGTVETGKIQAFRQDSDAFLQAADTSDYANALRELKIAELSGMADLSFSWGKWKLVFDQPGKVEARQIEEETHLAPVLRVDAAGLVDQPQCCPRVGLVASSHEVERYVSGPGFAAEAPVGRALRRLHLLTGQAQERIPRDAHPVRRQPRAAAHGGRWVRCQAAQPSPVGKADVLGERRDQATAVELGAQVVRLQEIQHGLTTISAPRRDVASKIDRGMDQIRSKIAAMPCPPPMHIVTSP